MTDRAPKSVVPVIRDDSQPLPLDYGRIGLPSDLRREVDVLADDFGGTRQIVQAITWGAAGAVIGSVFLRFQDGSTCFSTFLGVVGFGLGFFVRVLDKDGWARFGVAMACALVAGGVGSLLRMPRGALILSICAYRVGWSWIAHRQEQRDR